jgi:hypothetical protein
MKRKLCVAGCSFSDYTKVDKVYGEYLAEKLDFDYIHEGAGCGSNYRIWRRIVGHIINGTLTPNDIIVIQYTNPERKEFFSKNLPFPHQSYESKIRIAEPYQDGSIIRYKYWSDAWQDYENDREFFKLYERDHINITYDREVFVVNHQMFQSLCSEYNMNVIFINGHYIGRNNLDFKINDKYSQYTFHEDESFMYTMENRLAPDDMGHMSVLGHTRYSEMLYNHIKSLNLI